jgi:uncharacterized short protein YbdD (DUF466 family)
MTARDFVQSTRQSIERAACIVRRVIGVPDYDRYIAHLHAHHPDAEPLTHDEFVRERLIDKYSRPGSRCC